MQIPLGSYSVSIKAMATLTVQSVKYSENSRRVVQAQTKGLPSSVSCLQQKQYVDTQRKELIRQVHALKKGYFLFQPSSIFSSGHFLSQISLKPCKKLLHPQLALASSYTSVACCAKNYFFFLVLVASPVSFMCWLLVLVLENSLRLKDTLKVGGKRKAHHM